MSKRSMRDAVHRVRYYTLVCSRCTDEGLEGFPPETPQDVVKTAQACGWKFIKGEVWCDKCQRQPSDTADKVSGTE